MLEYQSQDITKLAKALLSVQRVLQPAIKDSVNPYAKNRYASLNSVMEVCRDPLISNGIWLCQYPVPIQSLPLTPPLGGVSQSKNNEANWDFDSQEERSVSPHLLGLVTKLTHAESGQWQSSLTVIPLPKSDPQGMGSAITYARRYALSAMLGIVTEEDLDGEYNKGASQNRQNGQNSYNAPQGNLRPNTSRARPSTEKTNKNPQNRRSESKNSTEPSQCSHQLPIINGVVYESIEIQDDKGNRREVITANGNTIPNKEHLMQMGFKWNPSKKVWWKYAD